MDVTFFFWGNISVVERRKENHLTVGFPVVWMKFHKPVLKDSYNIWLVNLYSVVRPVL